jgi:hypothetical protein
MNRYVRRTLICAGIALGWFLYAIWPVFFDEQKECWMDACWPVSQFEFLTKTIWAPLSWEFLAAPVLATFMLGTGGFVFGPLAYRLKENKAFYGAAALGILALLFILIGGSVLCVIFWLAFGG